MISKKSYGSEGYIKDWVEKKVRRHLMKARQRQGFGWERWSRETLYKTFGLYNGYKILKVAPSNRSHKL